MARPQAAEEPSALFAIILEERFEVTPEGAYFSPSGFGDQVWKRYTDVLGPVAIIARVAGVDRPSERAVPIEAPNVSFRPLPNFVGPPGLLLRAGAVFKALRRAMARSDAFILRAPGTLSLLAQQCLKREPKPFGVELVGDPHDVFSALGPMAGLLKPIFTANTRTICMSAAAVAYVTRETLQARYPATPGVFTTHYSSIELPPEMIVSTARPAAFSAPQPFRLLQVGSLEQLYKGTDVLIEAFERLVGSGRQVSLHIVGEGRYRAGLMDDVRRRGLDSSIIFVGRLSRDEVIREMDACDLLVHPSRTEGLPRVVIEAFARGVPVVATRIGGIPELVPPAHLVPSEDAPALANAIGACINDPALLAAMSKRNLEAAADYRADILAARRTRFYEAVASARRSDR